MGRAAVFVPTAKEQVILSPPTVHRTRLVRVPVFPSHFALGTRFMYVGVVWGRCTGTIHSKVCTSLRSSLSSSASHSLEWLPVMADWYVRGDPSGLRLRSGGSGMEEELEPAKAGEPGG